MLMKFGRFVWPLTGAILFVLACSDAPTVPVKPSNRVVLAELVSQVG
jgi:hypothetical protein